MQSLLIGYKIFSPASALTRISEDKEWNIHDIKCRALNLKTFWHILGNLTRRWTLCCKWEFPCSSCTCTNGSPVPSASPAVPHAPWGSEQHSVCVVRCLMYWLTEASLSLKGAKRSSILERNLCPVTTSPSEHMSHGRKVFSFFFFFFMTPEGFESNRNKRKWH